MPLRPPAGFISAFYDPLKVADAPTIGTATSGDANASVTFTAPSNVGGSAISAYYAVSNPGQVTGTGTSSPVSVTGLTNGTAYTFSVWALNTYGPSPFSASSNSVTPAAVRGLFGGGTTGSNSNSISYITFSSPGNAVSFGALTVARENLAAGSSSTRGVFAGGDQLGNSNVIDYVTFATTGNAASFGALTEARFGLGGCSSATRSVFIGGGTGVDTSRMDYITIASTGNASTFGNLLTLNQGMASCASPTRGVVAGGSPNNDAISYITIASTGNSATFGPLSYPRQALAGCSSSTRGVFGGGYVYTGSLVYQSRIDYITIASTGNSTNFGLLTVARYQPSACSSTTRGVFGGGYTGAYSNVIDYVTIDSTGNATNFGSLPAAIRATAACSNAHGGL